MRGGNFPIAYPYPAKMRATRDLLRRRMYIARRCTDLVVRIQNTNTQYNLPEFGKKISRKYNRTGVAERFEDPAVRKSVETDLSIIDSLNPILAQLEWHKESNGKWAGKANKKIGNHHLKWAIKEAAILFLRESSQAKAYVAKHERKYNKGKALGIFTHKLGRAIYFMLKNNEAFNMKQFFTQ